MEYRINFGFKAFAVPSAVVDHLIRLAKENHLKVLLYLLRNPEQNCSTAKIAGYLRLDEELVKEALEFWTQANILQDASQPEPDIERPHFAFSIPMTDMPQQPVPVSAPARKPDQKIRLSANTSEELVGMSQQDIADMIRASQDLERLIRDSQNYFHRDPNSMQVRSLVWMHEYLGMKNEIILILLQYCSSVQKISTGDLDRIAYNWWENDILTEELARKQVARLKELHSYVAYIRRLFEMDSNPTKSQKELIERWQQTGYSEELLQYAHDLTIEGIGKKNFKYIDRILQGWTEKGITDLNQAKKEHDTFVNILRLFGIKSEPTKNQEKIIEHWQQTGYPEELLEYAHDLSVEANGHATFNYICKILQNWEEKGITNLEQAKEARENFTKEKKSKGNPRKKESNKDNQITDEELEGYLRLVNRFKED